MELFLDNSEQSLIAEIFAHVTSAFDRNKVKIIKLTD